MVKGIYKIYQDGKLLGTAHNSLTTNFYDYVQTILGLYNSNGIFTTSRYGAGATGSTIWITLGTSFQSLVQAVTTNNGTLQSIDLSSSDGGLYSFTINTTDQYIEIVANMPIANANSTSDTITQLSVGFTSGGTYYAMSEASTNIPYNPSAIFTIQYQMLF